MNTSIHKSHVIVSTNSITNENKSFTRFWNNCEANRFGIVPVLLVVIACIGGITAAYATDTSAFRLGLVIFPTIISLAFILAVAPMRWIIWLSTTAVVIDILLFIF
ncbi:MAG TPA: hypothetical protein PK289_06245 [Bacteroidia bacterium]|jgi:hypothetical protein|nr:hypothetical protein [Bacteroidia bacterium]HRG52551.1 hypothetical protein [Bacteroidia bacterium]